MNSQKKLKQYQRNDLINKFSIPNVVKNVSLGTFQNYLVFIPAKMYI